MAVSCCGGGWGVFLLRGQTPTPRGRPSRLSRPGSRSPSHWVGVVHSPRFALIATVIAICVELVRLVHFPWLDTFRLTLPGALLLGRVFSVWNMVAYVVGIGFAVALDRTVVRAQ